MGSLVNLLLPMRILASDLDARTVLAVRAANAGFRVWFGHELAIHALARDLRDGVYVGFQAWTGGFLARRPYPDLKRRGFIVVCLDESAAVFPGDERDWAATALKRLGSKKLSSDDRIASWGQLQTDAYRQAQLLPDDNIVTTGHPRFELVKPAYRDYYAEPVAKMQREHGRFVLINTSFADGNSTERQQGLFKRGVSSRTDALRQRRLGEWAWAQRALSRFVELTHRLSTQLPDTTIVVRPHQSEELSFYTDALAGLANVRVTRAGAVSPWLLASSVLVHDSCTTAIEAHMADTPVVSYAPRDDSPGERPLPNTFGVRCETEDDAVDAVMAAISGRPVAGPGPHPRAPDLIANLTADSLTSFDALLDRARRDTGPPSPAPSSTTLLKNVLASEAREAARSALSNTPTRRGRRFRFERTRIRRLGHGQIMSRVRAAERLTQTRVSARLLGGLLVCVEPA
jgi:surface carbohydrate biosynthesis protein